MANEKTYPGWYLPVAVVALLWNVLGCLAYLSDVMLTADDVARMSAARQEMYAQRSAWVVSATAVAVWCGALGCVGLVWRKRWALPLLIASLVGVIVQDVGLYALTDAASQAGPLALSLQGLVLVVAALLVFLAHKATVEGWIPAKAGHAAPSAP